MATESPLPRQPVDGNDDGNDLTNNLSILTENTECETTTRNNRTFEISGVMEQSNVSEKANVSASKTTNEPKKDLTPEQIEDMLLEGGDDLTYDEALSEDALLAESSEENDPADGALAQVDQLNATNNASTAAAQNISSNSMFIKETNDEPNTDDPVTEKSQINDYVRNGSEANNGQDHNLEPSEEVDSSRVLDENEYEGKEPVVEEECIQKHINYGHDCDNVDETDVQQTDNISQRVEMATEEPSAEGLDEMDCSYMNDTDGLTKLIYSDSILHKTTSAQVDESAMQSISIDGLDILTHNILADEVMAANSAVPDEAIVDQLNEVAQQETTAKIPLKNMASFDEVELSFANVSEDFNQFAKAHQRVDALVSDQPSQSTPEERFSEGENIFSEVDETPLSINEQEHLDALEGLSDVANTIVSRDNVTDQSNEQSDEPTIQNITESAACVDDINVSCVDVTNNFNMLVNEQTSQYITDAVEQVRGDVSSVSSANVTDHKLTNETIADMGVSFVNETELSIKVNYDSDIMDESLDEIPATQDFVESDVQSTPTVDATLNTSTTMDSSVTWNNGLALESDLSETAQDSPLPTDDEINAAPAVDTSLNTSTSMNSTTTWNNGLTIESDLSETVQESSLPKDAELNASHASQQNHGGIEDNLNESVALDEEEEIVGSSQPLGDVHQIDSSAKAEESYFVVQQIDETIMPDQSLAVVDLPNNESIDGTGEAEYLLEETLPETDSQQDMFDEEEMDAVPEENQTLELQQTPVSEEAAAANTIPHPNDILEPPSDQIEDTYSAAECPPQASEEIAAEMTMQLNNFLYPEETNVTIETDNVNEINYSMEQDSAVKSFCTETSFDALVVETSSSDLNVTQNEANVTAVTPPNEDIPVAMTSFVSNNKASQPQQLDELKNDDSMLNTDIDTVLDKEVPENPRESCNFPALAYESSGPSDAETVEDARKSCNFEPLIYEDTSIEEQGEQGDPGHTDDPNSSTEIGKLKINKIKMVRSKK